MFKMLQGMSTKLQVSGAKKLLGFTPAEERLVGDFMRQLAEVGIISIENENNQPLTSTDFISHLVDSAPTFDVSKFGSIGSALKTLMILPEPRLWVVGMIERYMDNHPQSEMLEGMLQKVSNLPLPGFGDTEYDERRLFLANGLLPRLAALLPESQNNAEPRHDVTVCASCRKHDPLEEISEV